MKFGEAISKISAILAGIVVFIFACGMYLSAKGFVFSPDGQIFYPKKEASSNEVSSKPLAEIADYLPKNANVLGDVGAPVKIFEFSSFNCFYCAEFHDKVLPQVKKEFIDTKKVSLTFVDFPLDVKSMQAILLSDCLPKEKYFSYIEDVFSNQSKWGSSSDYLNMLKEYAIKNGAQEDKLTQCLSNEKRAKEVASSRQNIMENIDINATPSFVIVKGDVYYLIKGMPSFESLSKILNKN